MAGRTPVPTGGRPRAMVAVDWPVGSPSAGARAMNVADDLLRPLDRRIDGVDEAEDGRVGPDAERERQHGDRGERRPAGQPTSTDGCPTRGSRILASRVLSSPSQNDRINRIGSSVRLVRQVMPVGEHHRILRRVGTIAADHFGCPPTLRIDAPSLEGEAVLLWRFHVLRKPDPNGSIVPECRTRPRISDPRTVRPGHQSRR